MTAFTLPSLVRKRKCLFCEAVGSCQGDPDHIHLAGEDGKDEYVCGRCANAAKQSENFELS